MGKRYIAVSRQGEEAATIKYLSGVFHGDVSSFGEVFKEIIGATEAIERDMETRGMQGMEAARLAYFMAGCRVGAVHHVPEVDTYYRILVADFTSNGRAITPGLRVLDYDRREGTVEVGQFLDDGTMSPGGEYFDGWYEVVPDGETKRGKRFNGERMKAL
jgi:hypothetical protein